MICPSSPTKRRRRTKAEIAELRDALFSIIAEESPMTVRQVFYQAVSRGLIEKSEAEYQNVVGRLLTIMRRDGELPYDWIADNTRWMRKPRTYDGIGQLLNDSARLYRRSVWTDQDSYCEIWLEKEALAGVVYGVTNEFDVPLMVTRGYPSLSFVHSAAEAIGDVDKPVHLLYFGDRDPSGVDIPRFVEEQIRELAPWADIEFHRVAVTEEQIETMNLPTRPTKKTDTRAKGFKGESVELDAIPPATLREMVRDQIEELIDPRALRTLKIAEASEREWLKNLAGKVSKGGDDD